MTKLRPVLRSLLRDSPLEGALLQSYHAVRERLLRPLSDEEFAQRMYRSSARASLNLQNPVTFDEKQWWLKINYRDPLMTTCTDKITVREYVRQCGLGDTLWPLLGVFDTPSEIPWGELPGDFYLKTNHSSATNVRVAGAGTADRQRLERRLAHHLRRKHYPLSREWNYLGIKPRILAEPMLPTGGPRGLVDYRFFCSYGQVKGIFVDIGTADTNGNHASTAQRNVYDADWTLLPVKVSRPRIGAHDAPQPFDADKMQKVAERLSEPFPFCRVDLYNPAPGSVIFGEITFFHAGGVNDIEPRSFQNTLGEWVGLPTGVQPKVSPDTSADADVAPSASTAQTAVLVTTFNGGAYIEEQLHSIMEQTLPPHRVHVFDDGSTDDTVGIVKRFIKTHHLDQWTVTVNATNLGPAHNVLRNLKHLKAQTVFFADQDDVWDPNKMEVMHAYLQANPEVGLLLSETELVDGEGNPLPARLARHVRRSATRRSAQVRPIVYKRFQGESAVPLHAMAVRGDIVEEIASAFPFPPLSRSLGADWYIGMWATLTASAATLPDVLMRRRVHGSNISLGRLRKETALSTNRANRIAILEEARNAHAAVLESPVLARRMTAAQSSALRRMVALYDARLGFISEPSVGRALLLLKWTSEYITAGDSWRGGARALASDLAYGGNINFKTRRKMPRNA